MRKLVLFFLIVLGLSLSACTAQTTTTPVQKVSREIPVPTYGSGTHTVMLFADFQCPACIAFAATKLPVFESYAMSGKLQIQYYQYPLVNMHKNAYRDAIAALCAADQGKYMEYKYPLYDLEKSKAGATVTDADRVALAGTVSGIDVTQFGQCLAADTFAKEVDENMAYGDSLQVNGTPTVFLDGTKLDTSLFTTDAMLHAFLDRVTGTVTSPSTASGSSTGTGQ